MSKISVIMPVYNAERYLKKAIDSILRQSYSDFELIIIEDASTDTSKDIITSYCDERIKLVFNEENQGVVISRNKGLSISQGEYIALMDADDIAPHRRLEIENDYLDQDRKCDCVTGTAIYINENGEETGDMHKPFHNERFLRTMQIFRNSVANGSVLFRKSIIEKNNVQYRDIKCGIEDYMFWNEFLQYGVIKGIDKPLQYYRCNTNGLTLSTKMVDRDTEIDKVHKQVLQWYKFHLEDEELNTFLKLFREKGQIETKQEVNLLYSSLFSITRQAIEMQYDFVEELKTTCRKLYAEKLSKAYCLWE